MIRKPETNVGREGGICREIGPRGGAKDNFATVRENHCLPPITTPGRTWKPVKTTPHGHRG